MPVDYKQVVSCPGYKTEGTENLRERMDKISYDESLNLWNVLDEWGNPIVYEGAQKDMQSLENELIKLGSYFLMNHEELITESQSDSERML